MHSPCIMHRTAAGSSKQHFAEELCTNACLRIHAPRGAACRHMHGLSAFKRTYPPENTGSRWNLHVVFAEMNVSMTNWRAAFSPGPVGYSRSVGCVAIPLAQLPGMQMLYSERMRGRHTMRTVSSKATNQFSMLATVHIDMGNT